MLPDPVPSESMPPWAVILLSVVGTATAGGAVKLLGAIRAWAREGRTDFRADLVKRVAELEKKVDAQQADITALSTANGALRVEVAFLKVELAECQEARKPHGDRPNSG